MFIAWFQQIDKNWKINVSWVERKNQLADCMTNANVSGNKLLDALEKLSVSTLQLYQKKNERFLWIGFNCLQAAEVLRGESLLLTKCKYLCYEEDEYLDPPVLTPS